MMQKPTQEEAPKSRANSRMTWTILALAVALFLAIGIVPRILRAAHARDVVLASPVLHPEVIVVHPEAGSPESTFSIPADLQPLYTAAVYARTNGYVAKRLVDIGTHVKQGQLLALIATPEVDRQLDQAQATAAQAAAALEQAKAALQQAQANEQLARITRDRYGNLKGTKAVTQQSFDEADQTYTARFADVAAAKANVDAAEANLEARRADRQRTAQLKGFQQIVAPFDGVVTSRNVEQGDLVNDGSGGGAKSLFTVAKSDVLRVQAEVPQSAALFLKNGQQAIITVEERAAHEYTGTIVRTAESIDTNARTMLTEVQVDNRSGDLLPGMFGHIVFHYKRAVSSFAIPTTALVIDKNGTHVVEVDSRHHVHFVAIEIGQDFGKKVEIAKGLQGGETLVTNPSDLLNDGDEVTVVQP